MTLFEVDCDELEAYITRTTITFWNLLVTEGEEAPEKAEGKISSEEKRKLEETIGEIIDDHESQSPRLEFSQENDWHYVRNGGTLDNLLEIMLPLECEHDNDLLYLTSVIMKTLAESQVFADGNKRTAYLAGTVFLSNVQSDKGMTHTVVPALDKELRDKLQEIAKGDADVKLLYSFLESLRPEIKKIAKEEGVI